jgi:hypothetical protein
LGPQQSGSRLSSATPLVLAVGFIILYSYSLSYGYLWDDFIEVTAGFDEIVARLKIQFRLLYSLSFYLTNPIFDAAYQHRLVNIAIMGGAVFFAARAAIAYAIPAAPVVIAAIFLHPSFIYPTTWISQRNDGLLLLFLFLAMVNTQRVRGLCYLLLSDLSKAPWVFQNIWYSWRAWPAGRRWVVAIALLAIPLLMGQSLLFWSGVTSGASSPMTELAVEGLGGTIFTLVVRGAKVLEAVFLIHAPIAGYYGEVSNAGLLLLLCVYTASWVVIAYETIRTGGLRREGWHFLVLAVLMSIPFVANSDPRILGPAIPFYLLFWASLMGHSRWARRALLAVALLNFGATLLNYHISDTEVYEPIAALDYRLCGAHEITLPMEHWRCDRAEVAHAIVRRVNEVLR